jgi:hypothetical protein
MKLKTVTLAAVAFACAAPAYASTSNFPGYSGKVNDIEKFANFSLSCETLRGRNIIDITVDAAKHQVAWRYTSRSNEIKTALISAVVAYPNFDAVDDYGQRVTPNNAPPHLAVFGWGVGPDPTRLGGLAYRIDSQYGYYDMVDMLMGDHARCIMSGTDLPMPSLAGHEADGVATAEQRQAAERVNQQQADNAAIWKAQEDARNAMYGKLNPAWTPDSPPDVPMSLSPSIPTPTTPAARAAAWQVIQAQKQAAAQAIAQIKGITEQKPSPCVVLAQHGNALAERIGPLAEKSKALAGPTTLDQKRAIFAESDAVITEAKAWQSGLKANACATPDQLAQGDKFVASIVADHDRLAAAIANEEHQAPSVQTNASPAALATPSAECAKLDDQGYDIDKLSNSLIREMKALNGRGTKENANDPAVVAVLTDMDKLIADGKTWRQAYTANGCNLATIDPAKFDSMLATYTNARDGIRKLLGK